MHRNSMHRVSSFIGAVVLGVGLTGAAWAQSQSQSTESLGDLAREARAKQEAQQASGSAPKVITNQDLPAGSTAPQQTTLDTMTMVSGVPRTNHYNDQQINNRLHAEQRTSVEWKARLQEQENRIADLQARIDHVTSSMHAAVGTAQYDTPVNRYQAVQSERLATMQDMLEQQKRRLAMMQDAARHAGADQ